jgi:branched-chain amino acid transport system permease protein
MAGSQVAKSHETLRGQGTLLKSGLGLGLLLILLVFPFVVTLPFYQHLLTMIFIYGTLAQAWNILGGYCGQISLGNAVFFGAGAYTSTMLFANLGVSPWIGMLAGGMVAVLVSQVIGFPCFRLGGHYFAIATIAIGEIVQTVVRNSDWLGAAIGLYVPIKAQSMANFEFHRTKVPYYFIAMAIFGLSILVTYVIERSRIGYYFRAIKEDQQAAQSLGINITGYKLIAIAVCAFLSAIGGTFYAQYVMYIDPDSVFPLMLSILICLMPILGGLGTLWGPFIGAAIMIPLAEYARVWFSGSGKGLHLIIYGAIIMIMAIYQPEGIVGLLQKMRVGERRGAS